MYGLEISKNENIVSIIAYNAGNLPEKKASKVCSALENTLIDKGCKAIVVRGTSSFTHTIEINKNTEAIPVIFLPTGKMTATKKEQFFETVHTKLKKYGITNFILAGEIE